MTVKPAVFAIGNNSLLEQVKYTKKPETAVLDEGGQDMWSDCGTIPPNMLRAQEYSKSSYEMLKDGKSVVDVLDYNPGAVNHVFAIIKVHELLNKPEHRPGIQVYLLYGKTGLGKTYTIMHMLEPEIYNKPHPMPGQTDFWMGYQGEEAVLFDEFHPKRYPIVSMLGYLQEYAMRVPTKGGHFPARWKRVYISTNIPIEEWYKNQQTDPEHAENYRALMRRIPEHNRVVFRKRVPPHETIRSFDDLKAYQDSLPVEADEIIERQRRVANAQRTPEEKKSLIRAAKERSRELSDDRRMDYLKQVAAELDITWEEMVMALM